MESVNLKRRRANGRFEVLSTQENQTIFFRYLNKIFMDETGTISTCVTILTSSAGHNYVLGREFANCDTIVHLKTWKHSKLHK